MTPSNKYFQKFDEKNFSQIGLYEEFWRLQIVKFIKEYKCLHEPPSHLSLITRKSSLLNRLLVSHLQYFAY